MKKSITILFVLFYMQLIGQTYKIEATKLTVVPFESDEYIGQDQFGYQYSVKNKVFLKTKNKEKIEYKNFSLGKLSKVDIQNPLKIVLFYEDFNSVVLLDNQLNEIQKINFSTNATPLVITAIGIASQNQLWVYDNLNQQIGLFDYLKNNYKAVSTSFPDSIKQYRTDFNTFYWIDDKNDFFSCDIFGKINTKGKIADFEMIEIINDHQFIYSNNNILTLEDIEKEVKYEIETLEKTFKKFSYKDQILSIFTSKGIINYKITIP